MYVAPWTVFAMNWSMRLDKRWRLAIGSFIEDYTNKVSRVLMFYLGARYANVSLSTCVYRATFDHPYPTTKIMWIPDPATHYPDLLATSGDYLRLWRVGNGEVHLLNNVS